MIDCGQEPADTKQAIVLFGRYPELGCGKSRLAEELGAEQTLLLYQGMLADTAWKIGAVSGCTPIAAFFAGFEFESPPPDPLGRDPFSNFRLVRQSGSDFGTRLADSMKRPFDLGYERTVLLGADSPELEQADLELAIELLELHDVVLGPSEDGGYYLIGMNRHHPHLFEEMTWSTSAVFEQTVKRAEGTGLSVGFVSRYSDIDYFDDLKRLARRRLGPSGRSSPVCPATDAWLEGSLRGQEGVSPFPAENH